MTSLIGPRSYFWDVNKKLQEEVTGFTGYKLQQKQQQTTNCEQPHYLLTHNSLSIFGRQIAHHLLTCRRRMHNFHTFLGYFQILSLFQTTLSFPLQLSTSLISSRREAIQTTIVATTSLGMTAPNANSAIKWGIVGLGDVCQVKSGPPFWLCDGSELVAVMRRTPDKAKEFANKVPGGNCVGYEDIDAFLSHPDLDAVYVSTRPGTHLEICKKVAQAGKSCYVEKPVGRCAEEAEEITKIFRDAKLKLYTAFISRAYDRTLAVRKLLSEGAIGDRIMSVSYSLVGSGGARDMSGDSLPWRLDAAQSGGGLIMDVGCHVIDRIDYLCGPLCNVNGQAKNTNSPNIPVEDFVHFTADIGDGDWAALPVDKDARVECTWDFASKDSEPFDELAIIGSKGSLKMAGMSPALPVKHYNEKGELVQELNFEMPLHTAQALIQAVTNDLRGLETSNVLALGDNAIRSQKVIDVALDSYYGGRESGYWARTNWPGKV